MGAARSGLPEAEIFDDYRQLCESGLVDLVEIIVPHHLHYELAAFAIGCDLHVSLQKPLSLSLDDADRLISAARESSKVVRLYENFLFCPPVLKALELIEQGLIGEPLSVRLKSNAGYSPSAWDIPFSSRLWRNNPDECGGGPLVFDDGHHKFSLAWIVLGQPAEVHAWIGSTHVRSFGLDSPSLVSMRYESGAVASLEIVYSQDLLIEGTSHYAQDDRMEITGTRGVVWVNRGHGRIGDAPPVASYADGHVETYGCETGWERSFIGATRSLLGTIAAALSRCSPRLRAAMCCPPRWRRSDRLGTAPRCPSTPRWADRPRLCARHWRHKPTRAIRPRQEASETAGTETRVAGALNDRPRRA